MSRVLYPLFMVTVITYNDLDHAAVYVICRQGRIQVFSEAMREGRGAGRFRKLGGCNQVELGTWRAHPLHT